MADITKHICRVGTARIDYQGHVGQHVLNTTVKSGMGLGAIFAPTWKMVMDSKQNSISWQMYIEVMWNMSRCQVVKQHLLVIGIRIGSPPGFPSANRMRRGSAARG